MEAQERIESDWMPTKTTDGRDELNLAEFPLCALAHRLRPDQKTIRFEDRVWDERRGTTTTRQLTITGSDAYGLPTALDDEVLLGLIQLTKLRSFADRKVAFSRYELIGLLGWRDESKSYERIETSLNRWTGVTLYYQNAWWNKARQCWVNEKFHVLDNVWLCHRADRAFDTAEGVPLSAFVWNEVLFGSFQAGNLKSIDFDFFKSLDSAVAKRLYRFLDKRFFHKRRWDFNLNELAWEHVGLARSYDSTSLKRKLIPAITELEQKGFIQPMPEPERFRKVRAGEWRVTFVGTKNRPPGNEPVNLPGTDALITALTERGVSPSTATTTVRKYRRERITTQIEVFDWMLARKDPKVSRNPPGFLISAIKGEYAPPKDFISLEDQRRREHEITGRKHRAESKRRERLAGEEARQVGVEKRVQSFLKSLPEAKRAQVEAEALAQASPFQRKLLARRGSGAEAMRKSLLNSHVLKCLQTDDASKPGA